MPRTAATVTNADLLRPQTVRNQMLETVDQMERINMGDEDMYASATSTFPMINLSNPTEAYYAYDGVTDAMPPVGFDAEPPMMSVDLPDQRNIMIDGYKQAFNPKKGVETALDGVPFSAFQRGISKLNTKIFLTRELIAWRGDPAIDGLIGPFGNNPNSDIRSDNIRAVSNSWSNSTEATPYRELETLGFDLVNNGYMGAGQVQPTIFMGPRTMRDLKFCEDMENRLPDTQYQTVSQQAVSQILAEEIGDARLVMVYYPRKNANGEYIDENGDLVDDADEAARDNILEPYDPSVDRVRRNVVVGRPGPQSAYFPWFLDRLTEDVGPGDIPGEMDVDENRGFLTYVYKHGITRETYVSAEQELGFEITRGENWGLLTGV